MDLTTLTDIISGSPFKPLLRHRRTVLEALGLLSRQLQGQLSTGARWQGRPNWLAEFSSIIEKHERDIISSLYQPSLTAQPKDRIQTMLQTQNNLAHLICRLAERFSYRPLQLPEEMNNAMTQLCQNFGKAIYHLRHGVDELENRQQASFHKPASDSITGVLKNLMHFIEAIRANSQTLREQAFMQESGMNQLDIALLLLMIDDMEDLTLWMKTMVIQLQPK